jgi:hypothetical protein
MNALDWIGLVDATRKRLLARVDLAGADYGDVVENRLEEQTLAAYREALKDAPEGASLAWLIGRVAQLEARVEALSRALWAQSATAGPAVAAPAAELDGALVLMDENVVQDGFHGVERNGAGVAYRWLGPDPVARVYLPKVRPPVELTIMLAGIHKRVDVRALRVAFNNGPWTPVEIDQVAGAIRLRCRPVAGALPPGLLHYVDIDCGATFSPADEGHHDTRKLGVALSRIEVAGVG